MSEEHNADEPSGTRRINRRSVLKGIAASSVAATGFAANVSASTQTDSTTVRNAQTSSKVRSIQSDLGIASLPEPESGQVTINRGDSGEDFVFKYVFFFMEPGTLLYSVSPNDQTTAQFHFGTGREDYSESLGYGSKADTSKQPASVSVAKQYRSLPEETHNTLIATGDGGTMYRRTATDDEVTMLRNVDEVSIDDESVVVGSDINGFYTTTIKGEGEDATKLETRVTVDDVASVDPTQSLVAQFDATDFSKEQTVHVNDIWSHPCYGICVGCAGNLTGCALCATACTNPVTLWACATCFFAVCHALLFTTCGSCGDCLSEHGI